MADMLYRLLVPPILMMPVPGVTMASLVNQLPIAVAKPIVVPFSVAVLVMLALPQSPITPAPL